MLARRMSFLEGSWITVVLPSEAVSVVAVGNEGRCDSVA